MVCGGSGYPVEDGGQRRCDDNLRVGSFAFRDFVPT